MRTKFFLLIGIAIIALVSCSNDSDDDQFELPERNYTKLIERLSENSFEAELISKAEAHYPPREAVVEAAQWSGMEVPETNWWYYNHFDGVLIPYCITTEAIDYYADLIDQYNANKEDVFFITAEFSYTADVDFYETYTSPASNSVGSPVETKSYEAVYVVTLDLKWTNYCGPLCAMWIDTQRIAVFNQSGELLDVFLDGEQSVAVS
ncbi:hypothetical protein [uncultured Draconibacterium sp.]|uniref:hypothetical protein n=1 Tax=uncultured Draconibacterium sp. TaxID=1573823 RepID=UPI00326115F8